MSLDHGPSGAHTLPPRFSGGSAHVSPPPRRRSRSPLLIGGAVLVVGVIAGAVQLTANLGYDSLLEDAEAAVAVATQTHRELQTVTTELTETDALGQRMSSAVSERLVGADGGAALSTALLTADEALADAETALSQAPVVFDEKPGWAWDLFAAQTELVQLEAEARTSAAARTETAEAVQRAEETLAEAAIALARDAAAAAPGFESRHINARNPDIVDMRETADAIASSPAVLDGSLVDAYAALEAATQAMLKSEQSEQWEKAGPLRDARVAVEAFARDLAPGLLLDFDWAEFVNGYGEDDSMGGRASWWYGTPGYATIELSDSVAEEWPNARSKALVAHEVGHAISVRCQGMYDDTDAATVEDWATAWAISMGHTDDANGTWAYGPPPQSLIDAAAKCR